MKLYVISGLGADFSVLEKIVFPKNIDVVFLDWIIPDNREDFYHYVKRMAERIDNTEPFSLLGYSFGGLVVQEIDKIKKAEKVIILGSIKSDKEKSSFIKFGELSGIPKYLPQAMFNMRSASVYAYARKMVDPRNPGLMQYLKVTDPYYLKWGIEKVTEWKFKENPDVIQILGSKDIVFPVKHSNPDYIVENGTHLFPLTKHKQVSKILAEIFSK